VNLFAFLPVCFFDRSFTSVSIPACLLHARLPLPACLLNCPVCPHLDDELHAKYLLPACQHVFYTVCPNLGDELHVAEVEYGGEDAPDDVGGLVRETEPLDGLDDPRVVRPLAGGVRGLLVFAGQVPRQSEGGSYNLFTRVADPDPDGSALF
jgi:hypothetical protein